MDFEKRERMLDLIRSEISNSENNINKLVSEEENKNAFIGKVNNKLKKYQKEKMSQKLAQINYIDMLYDYLEKKNE